MRIHLPLAAIPFFLCIASGCSPGGSEAAERRTDSAAQRDSVAAAAAASMSENQVLGLLAASDAADSATGALGAARASSTEVKEFARMILREHHALRKEALDLGTRLGIEATAPVVPPDHPDDAALAVLDSTHAGPAWDRAYIDYAISVHESAFENTARALAAARRPETKELIERAVPILQKHIDKARALQRSLPNARTDTSARSGKNSAKAKGAPLR